METPSLWFVCHNTSFLGEKRGWEGAVEERVQKLPRCLVNMKAWTFCNSVSVFKNGSGTRRRGKAFSLTGVVSIFRICWGCCRLKICCPITNSPSLALHFCDSFLCKIGVVSPSSACCGLLIGECPGAILIDACRLSSLCPPFVAASSLCTSWSPCAFSSANTVLLEICAAEKQCLCGRASRRKVFCKQDSLHWAGLPNSRQKKLPTKF